MQNIIETGTMTMVAGKTTKLDLDVGYVVQNTYLVLDAIFTLQGGTSPTSRANFGGLLNAINELKITLNDRDDVLRLSGRELAAIYAGDHGRLPENFQLLPLGAATQKAIIPLNHYTTNSDVLAYTAHDYRQARKAVLSITWGSIADMYGFPNDLEMELSASVIQQAVHSYNSPVTVKQNGQNYQYKPSMRYFHRTLREFEQGASGDVELGRLENIHPSVCKGFYMFGTWGRTHLTDAITKIRLLQGNRTLATMDMDIIALSHEQAKGAAPVDGVHYVPFSSLFRSNEFEQMDRWQDDIIIRGDINPVQAGGFKTVITTLADAYRQEQA